MDSYDQSRAGKAAIRPRLLGIALLALFAAMVLARVREGVLSFREPEADAAGDRASSPSTDESGAPAADEDSAAATAGLPYKLAEGPYRVAEIRRIVLHDPKRNKDLPVHIFYPDAAGPFPVVVFSHGAGGSGDCCAELPRHWAGYGYVALLPTHADSVQLRRENGEDIGIGQGMLEAVASIVNDPGVLANRARDISLLLDSLDDLQKREPRIAGKLDQSRIGMSGHSMGSMTTQLVSGATLGSGASAQHFADDRVRAAEILSGGGRLRVGQNEHSWDAVHIPLMALAGSRDPGSVIGGPGFGDERREVYDFLPAGEKYNVYLEGANHMTFIGMGRVMPSGIASATQAALFRYVQMSTLAFWDAYLKDDAHAREWLVSGSLEAYSRGAAKVSHK